jgi:C4-dicarboxylate-binding protein DctP
VQYKIFGEMTMKRIVLILVGVVLTWGVVVSSAIASDYQPIELVAANIQTMDGSENVALALLADIINKKTEGKVTVKIFPDSQLGTEREIAEQNIMGNVDLAMSAPSLWSGVINVPELGVFSLPMLYTTTPEMSAVINKVLIPATEKYLVNGGLRPIMGFSAGWRKIMTRGKPVEVAEDMVGLKVRVAENPIYIDTFRNLGANPVPIPWSETYTAFQSGVIDMIDSDYQALYNAAMYEIAKFVTETGHLSVIHIITINEEKWQSLPQEVQTLILEAVPEVQAFQIQEQLKNEKAFEQRMKDAGVTILPFPDAEKAALRKKLQPMYDEYINKYNLADLITQMEDVVAQTRSSQ